MPNSLSDNLSKKKILSYINNTAVSDIIVLKTVNSTNSYSKNLALCGFKNNTVVLADTQTNGRGRLGREFFSPAKTGIYMSILIDPSCVLLPASLVTVAAGTAVCRVLKSFCSIPASIKWVNDIFVNGKKVCGILAESVFDTDKQRLSAVIVGIGLNVSTPNDAFPGELRDIADSVFPQNISRNKIAAKIIDAFSLLCKSSDIKALIKEYEAYNLVIGKKISFSKDGEACFGTAIAVNCEGNLVVALENGETLALNSGEISLGSSNFAD